MARTIKFFHLNKSVFTTHPMEVLTKAETMALIEGLQQQVTTLQHLVAELIANQAEWVTQDEACRLAGRSRRWFTLHRTNDTLPIAMQPRTSDSGRIFFSRADCVKYAQDHCLAPPASWHT